MHSSAYSADPDPVTPGGFVRKHHIILVDTVLGEWCVLCYIVRVLKPSLYSSEKTSRLVEPKQSLSASLRFIQQIPLLGSEASCWQLNVLLQIKIVTCPWLHHVSLTNTTRLLLLVSLSFVLSVCKIQDPSIETVKPGVSLFRHVSVTPPVIPLRLSWCYQLILIPGVNSGCMAEHRLQRPECKLSK